MYPTPNARRFVTVEKTKADLDAAEARDLGYPYLSGFCRGTALALALEVDSLTQKNEELLERLRKHEGIAEVAE